MAVLGHQIGKALCDALGLPKHTIAFTLNVRTGNIVTVECEYCPDIKTGDLTPTLAQYELMRKAEPAKAKPMHFDAWMRNRTDKAHAAYMAQHAAGGIEYMPRAHIAVTIDTSKIQGNLDRLQASIARLDAHNLT